MLCYNHFIPFGLGLRLSKVAFNLDMFAPCFHFYLISFYRYNRNFNLLKKPYASYSPRGR